MRIRAVRSTSRKSPRLRLNNAGAARAQRSQRGRARPRRARCRSEGLRALRGPGSGPSDIAQTRVEHYENFATSVANSLPLGVALTAHTQGGAYTAAFCAALLLPRPSEAHTLHSECLEGPSAREAIPIASSILSATAWITGGQTELPSCL